jgi:hypothetical protein
MTRSLMLGSLIICAMLFAITRSTATSNNGGAKPAPSPLNFRGDAPAQSSANASVTSDGCVRAGVEAGCLILTTADKKNKYSLHFDPNNKPSADTMIHFEGTTLDVDTCMQGTPVKVAKWNALKMKCPAESK